MIVSVWSIIKVIGMGLVVYVILKLGKVRTYYRIYSCFSRSSFNIRPQSDWHFSLNPGFGTANLKKSWHSSLNPGFGTAYQENSLEFTEKKHE